MSTVKTNNVQIGQSVTATNNFTWYQPSSPDGTVRLGNGNAGSVTDLVTVNSSGNVGIGTSSPSRKLEVNGYFRVTDGTSQAEIVNGGGVAYYGTSNNYPIAFQVNSAEKMRLDASGNLGLGVTPSAWGTSSHKAFDIWTRTALANDSAGATQFVNNGYYNGSNWIYKATAAASFYQQASGAHTWLNAPSGTAGNAISFTQAMTLDASGNLLVGTTSLVNNEKLALASSTDTNLSILSANYATQTNDILQIRAARNTTNNSFKAITYYNSGASAFKFYVIDGGNIYSTSATVNVISDQRLKENVRDLDTGLAEILALRPRRFDWKENQGDGSKNTPGFIAQEVEQVMPEIVVPWNVTGTDKDDHKGLATGNLIPTLVKAIQELSAELNELKKRIH